MAPRTSPPNRPPGAAAQRPRRPTRPHTTAYRSPPSTAALRESPSPRPHSQPSPSGPAPPLLGAQASARHTRRERTPSNPALTRKESSPPRPARRPFAGARPAAVHGPRFLLPTFACAVSFGVRLAG